MRVCVLTSAYLNDSPLAELDPAPNPALWMPTHEVVTVSLQKAEITSKVHSLIAQGFDVFLNLCDGAWFEELAGIEVVEELERYKLAFTGPSSRLYTLGKEEMKRVALSLRVATPAAIFAESPADIQRAIETLRFPVIVKHFDGFGSVGMTRASCVREPSALLEQAQQMIALAGKALIEEFIEGDEYTVMVVENPEDPEQPKVLTPVRCRFPEGETFKHFDLKWQSYKGLAWEPCTDPLVSQQLLEATRQIFVGLQGASYSRCDFRVDALGQVWFLEINTSCGVFYPPGAEGSADLILQFDPLGHEGFIEEILRCALLRKKNLSA